METRGDEGEEGRGDECEGEHGVPDARDAVDGVYDGGGDGERGVWDTLAVARERGLRRRYVGGAPRRLPIG